MKVALILCPMWDAKFPVYALALFNAQLKHFDHEVRIVDLNREIYTLGLSREYKNSHRKLKRDFDWTAASFIEDSVLPLYGHYFDSTVDRLLSEGFRVFAFSLYYTNLMVTLHVARLIKQRDPGATIIFGGSDCMFFERCLELMQHDCVDAVVYGEADRSFPELINSLRDSGRLKPAPGVLLRADPSTWKESSNPPMDLDALPYADYEGYSSHSYDGKTVHSCRGCVKKCVYCSQWKSMKFRQMTGQRIFNEIIYQLDAHPSQTHFIFGDSLINGVLKHLIEFCDLMARNKIKVSWAAHAIARPEMTVEVFTKMRRAGCREVWFGTESGSEKILTAMGKHVSPQLNAQNVRNAALAGIKPLLNMIVGFPTETEEDFQESIKFIDTNAEYIGFVAPHFFDAYMLTQDDRSRFDLTSEKHSLYWKTRDGRNDFSTRLRRMERLMDCVKSGGIRARHDNMTVSSRRHFELLKKEYREWSRASGCVDFRVEVPPLAGMRETMRAILRVGVRAAADWAARDPFGGALRPLFALYYASAEKSVRAWARLTRQAAAGLRVHRGYAGKNWTPGVSDIDFAAIWTAPPNGEAAALARWSRGYARLRRVFPMLGEATLADERDWAVHAVHGGFRACLEDAFGDVSFARVEEALLAYGAMTAAFLGSGGGVRRSRAVVKGFVDVSRLCATGPVLERETAARDLARGLDGPLLARAQAGFEDGTAHLCARAAARLEAAARAVAAPAGAATALPYAVARAGGAAEQARRTYARLGEALGIAPRWAVFDVVSGVRAEISALAQEGAAPAWSALRAAKERDPFLSGSFLAGGSATLAVFARSAAGEDPLKALSWRAAEAGAASGAGPFLKRHTIAACGGPDVLPAPPERERVDAAMAEHAATTLLNWRGRIAGPDGASREDRWTRLMGAALSLRAWAERGELLPGFPLEPLALRHATAHPEDADWILRRVVGVSGADFAAEDVAALSRQFRAVAARL